MPDEPQQQALPLAETPPAEPKAPKPPPPSRAERQERARELVAEQRLTDLQGQIGTLQQQLGAVGQHLVQTQNQQWQDRLAEMSPAERAEAQSQAAMQQVQNLTNALQNQQRGQPQESPEQRYERRSRELEQEYGIPRDEWDKDFVEAGEKATVKWLGKEVARREAEAAAAAATPAPAAATEPSYAATSGRASAPPPVQDSDYQRIAWDGVSRQKGGAGRSYGVQGRSQAKVVAQLTELRNQAYREAGIG